MDADKMRNELSRYSKTARRNKVFNTLKSTKAASSAGVHFEKSASIKTTTVNGQTVVKHETRATQKMYRVSKSLI